MFSSKDKIMSINGNPSNDLKQFFSVNLGAM